MTLPDPPILVITDRLQCPEPLDARAEKLFRGGCRWLSLREKDLDAGERLSLLARLIAIGSPFGARVGVHGDREAAIACAAPLHLPAGADLEAARRLVGPTILLGQSCHNDAEIRAAAGADYVTLGPFFASASKPGYESALSAADLTRIADLAPCPVLALGGIAPETLSRLAGTAIGGLAVMGPAMRSPDPEPWFRQLAARWRERQG